jgi:hypothetical protein
MSYNQPPPPPYGAPPIPPTTPARPRWARKRIAIPAAAVILLIGIGIGSAGNGDGSKKTSAAAHPAATQTVTAQPKKAAPAPTVTVTKTAKAAPKAETAADTAPSGKALFKVWGSAPSGADITYGNDGTNLAGHGLPMTKTLTVKDDALYYQVTAQLQGGGNVHCSVTIDGKTKTGQASGGYNICSAQLNSDFSGGYS